MGMQKRWAVFPVLSGVLRAWRWVLAAATVILPAAVEAQNPGDTFPGLRGVSGDGGGAIGELHDGFAGVGGGPGRR